ncbi:hypothetical protein WA026_001522 [Henosepilachna vigintioctopunctata]|uniref:Protein sleepless n=1 Tax=Henosepilachna vigintioctopunctata TaxID=420089 RepID=A0AAW1UIJ1_9CUCU
MNIEIYYIAVMCVILSSIDKGYGLKCYKCNGKNDDDCVKGSSSLPTTECSVLENKCGIFEYDIMTGSSVIATGFQRGCALEDGYCELVEKTANALLKATGGSTRVHQKNCDLCDKDYCNNSSKVSGSIILLTVFLLISWNVFKLF